LTDSTKKTKGLILLVASFALVFIIAACTTEVEVPVEVIKEVIKEVPVQTEVIKTVEVIREVAVEKLVEVQVIKEVAVEVQKIVFAEPVPAGPKTTEAGQTFGGTIKFGMIDFGTLDPALMGLSQASSVYSELAYDNATVLWYDGEVTPWVLESWDSSNDLTQYTFKVRGGIQFHNGQNLTSADIKYTFDRILDPETASPLLGQIEYIENITTPDANTVVFNLDGANAFMPSNLTDYHARILPTGSGDKVTSSEVGSGAYTLADHNPTERTVMERNPNYWRENRPFADQMLFFYMPEQVTRVEAIKSGAIDIVLEPSFSSLSNLEANPKVKIAETPSAGVRVIDMHTYEGSPFADKNLRKAMQYAVDRNFVREAALFGRGSNANDHPVGINDQYYWDNQPLTKQDIPRAKEYLALAGYPDGFDITLDTADMSQMLDVALAFKESVADAGINVTVNLNDSGPYWEAQWMNDCCPFITSNWGARPANAALDVQLRSGGIWNESFYDNARLDELLDMANAEGDLVKRKSYYQEIQEILIEDVPVLYLMHFPTMIAHRDNVQGVIAHSGLAHVFAEEWWIER